MTSKTVMVGGLVNRLMETSNQPAPEVGMGGTVCYYSDRAAVTVVEVSRSGKLIRVQKDTATRVDSNGMSECQDYQYSRNPDGATSTFSLRKTGCWVAKGQPARSGTKLYLGTRNSYHDFSF